MIGVAHPDFGEAVLAIIVLENTAAGQALEDNQIMAILKDQLAKFKQPKAIKFVEALPRNTMGKVQKAEMRKTYADLFSA